MSAQLATLPVATMEPATLMAVIARAAADPACDIEKMERLMQMHERMEARTAEAAFNASMSTAQASMGPISADATNPQTRSKYATYAKLDSALRPIYTREGFALSFGTADGAQEGSVRVLCHVSHSAGHTRPYHIDMPNDGKGAKGNDVMTKTHATGSAMTYGQRYLLKLIFNVAIGEDDNDGNGDHRRDDDAQTKAQALVADWLQVIGECPDLPTLTARKVECVKAYGHADKVPASLKQAFGSRTKALTP